MDQRTESRVVTVEIHGQRYPIRSALDAAYVAELAAYVDEKMRLAARESPAGRHAEARGARRAQHRRRVLPRRRRRIRTARRACANRAARARTHARSGPRRSARARSRGRPLDRSGRRSLLDAASGREVRSLRSSEFPALRVMVGGSFEPTFHQVSRDAAWCACLCKRKPEARLVQRFHLLTQVHRPPHTAKRGLSFSLHLHDDTS